MRRNVTWIVVLVLGLLVPCVGAQEEGGAKNEATHQFGVVSFYSPRMMFLKYQPLVDYLSEQTGQPWELHINTSYQQTVDELCSGELTAAYLGPLTYVRAHAECGAEPILRLQTSGRDTYRSYILVRENSPVREVADLEGKRFGFGSALSTSSHLVPRAMLVKAGIDLGAGTRCLYFEHHERAARAVLTGEADACGVRDIVGEKFLGRGLRILARSRPIPNFPFVIAPQGSDEIRRQIVRALVELPKEDPAIARRMAAWDEELARGFVSSNDAEYEMVRTLAGEVFGPESLTLPAERLRCSDPDR